MGDGGRARSKPNEYLTSKVHVHLIKVFATIERLKCARQQTTFQGTNHAFHHTTFGRSYVTISLVCSPSRSQITSVKGRLPCLTQSINPKLLWRQNQLSRGPPFAHGNCANRNCTYTPWRSSEKPLHNYLVSFWSSHGLSYIHTAEKTNFSTKFLYYQHYTLISQH